MLFRIFKFKEINNIALMVSRKSAPIISNRVNNCM